MSQEVRDAVARLNVKRAWDEDGLKIDLPYIPDDLTACAKAWDEQAGAKGWWWIKKNKVANGTVTIGEWTAYSLTQQFTVDPSGTDAASELRDRWELLGLVLQARGVV
jgi:hypothetical protein